MMNRAQCAVYQMDRNTIDSLGNSIFLKAIPTEILSTLSLPCQYPITTQIKAQENETCCYTCQTQKSTHQCLYTIDGIKTYPAFPKLSYPIV